MKTQKLNLDAFATNELSKNQKKVILGKGDATIQLATFTNSTILLSASTTTTPTIPPGGLNGGNGDAKIIG